MAASHFLVHSTTIEVFSWGEVNTAINQIISRHRTFAWPSTKPNGVEGAAFLLREVREEFLRCGYEDGRYPYPCAAPATVIDIETGCTFCASHFREVIR